MKANTQRLAAAPYPLLFHATTGIPPLLAAQIAVSASARRPRADR
jgi:hypothetical protein